MNFGESVRAARRKRRLSQAQLAAMVGIDRGYISQIEHGRDPSTDVRFELAEALGVPMALLTAGLGREEFLLRLKKLAKPRRVDVDSEPPTPATPPTPLPTRGEVSVPVVSTAELDSWDWKSFDAIAAVATETMRLDGDADDPTSFALLIEGAELRPDAAPSATQAIVSPAAGVVSGDYVLVRADFGPAVRRYVEASGRRELRGMPDQRVVYYTSGMLMLCITAFLVETRRQT